MTKNRPYHRVVRARRPDWWRGTRPERGSFLGGWVETGVVPEIDADRLSPGTYQDLVSLAFSEAQVSGLTIPLDEAHLAVAWSEFSGCTFTQRSRRLMADGSAAQGSFGTRPSIYRDCTFKGVQFGSPGRFSLGAARFERCVFDKCGWRSTFNYEADLMECVFTGKMQSGAFGGESSRTGRRNEILGNDFSAAEISDNFAWRFGFPVAEQTWPAGYVPLQDMQAQRK
jgi:hypothetical protein